MNFNKLIIELIGYFSLGGGISFLFVNKPDVAALFLIAAILAFK